MCNILIISDVVILLYQLTFVQQLRIVSCLHYICNYFDNAYILSLDVGIVHHTEPIRSKASIYSVLSRILCEGKSRIKVMAQGIC